MDRPVLSAIREGISYSRPGCEFAMAPKPRLNNNDETLAEPVQRELQEVHPVQVARAISG
jgi:hypothetical protein